MYRYTDFKITICNVDSVNKVCDVGAYAQIFFPDLITT